MTFRGNGTLITHNNTTYIPSSLMPGYCGHIPTTKFLYGETFGNSSLKYLQNIRSAMMASSKSSYSSVPLSSQTQDSILPYWVRYNIDFKRQKEIKDFNMLIRDHAISDGSLIKSNGVHHKQVCLKGITNYIYCV
uniref:Ciliary microtubule inner protein 2C n=1 Tax=Cyprinus carpio carpio TaxID=630221 RepID=A0A9J8B4G9_CYPCA